MPNIIANREPLDGDLYIPDFRPDIVIKCHGDYPKGPEYVMPIVSPDTPRTYPPPGKVDYSGKGLNREVSPTCEVSNPVEYSNNSLRPTGTNNVTR